MKNNISIIALIVANSLPLAGVIWLDWAVFDVLILYWAENVVIGIINVMRMNKCLSSPKLGYFIIPFFIVHYGMFCFGHYSAVVMMFDRGQWHAGLWVAIAAIATPAISQTISWSSLSDKVGSGLQTNSAHARLSDDQMREPDFV